MTDISATGGLFELVQTSQVFPDGKTFVDCTPTRELSHILNEFHELKDEPGFNLNGFIQKNFILPKEYVSDYYSDKTMPVKHHIEKLWDELTRQPGAGEPSLIPLPHAYIVPGGRFREIFYWDSYFTMLGLDVSGRQEMIHNMLDNFSYLIDKFGYIPNGNRSYFLGRSQPPFFASMVQLLHDSNSRNAAVKGNIRQQYLGAMEKEYSFWMKRIEQLNNSQSFDRVTFMPDGEILNHYWDANDSPRPESYKEDVELAKDVNNPKQLFRNIRAACESGWDFSCRWFRDIEDFTSIHTTEIIPVDLNCLLFNLERTIAETYRDTGSVDPSGYEALAEKRKAAINKYCWNNDKKFYFDFDYVSGRQKTSLTLASTYPLFFKIATPEQAAGVADNLQKLFLHAGGLQTTLIYTGQQWDAPNGWAPLQWIAIAGLMNYGFNELAEDIAKRWMLLNEKVYKNTGRMMEKYNVVDIDLPAGGGEYQSQDGFGWTNGVYLALKKRFF